MRELADRPSNTNFIFVFSWADAANQMPELAAELVRAGVKVIFVPSSTETAAVLQVTENSPCCFPSRCRSC